MKTVYLECATGVSGDMLLAGLASAAADPAEAIAELGVLVGSLGLGSLEIRLEKRNISSISMHKVCFSDPGEQPLRTIGDIERVLEGGELPQWLQQATMQTLRLLGEAEAKVHGTVLDSVHFHEIGAVDTIVDIVGGHYLTRRLRADRILASPVNLGSGFVTFSHGTFPVPAPACAELAKGVVTFGSALGMEAATPTGLALLQTLVDAGCEYGPQPLGRVVRVGYGCGDRSSDALPTFVRVFVLETEQEEAR